MRTLRWRPRRADPRGNTARRRRFYAHSEAVPLRPSPRVVVTFTAATTPILCGLHSASSIAPDTPIAARPWHALLRPPLAATTPTSTRPHRHHCLRCHRYAPPHPPPPPPPPLRHTRSIAAATVLLGFSGDFAFLPAVHLDMARLPPQGTAGERGSKGESPGEAVPPHMRAIPPFPPHTSSPPPPTPPTPHTPPVAAAATRFPAKAPTTQHSRHSQL
ncbi:WAS/WASL-interacting protein family member 3-like [Penaeus monodon]|uniref:WAS/WASL-interacting protein family member 3-like n=1 Tax=Penaeus monodon TaxID=6687 RepID=UPI0018A779EF|nr:WAS/WASL-interacting protein family member 3-like [Penaeus monodon]